MQIRMLMSTGFLFRLTLGVVLSIFVSEKVFSQDSVLNKKIFKTEVFVFGGKSVPHHPEMKELCKKPYFGTEIRLGWQADGSEYWHQAFNYPYYGFGYYVADFNTKAIGYPMALFSFIELPFYRGKKSSISTSWSAGMAFHINEYNAKTNRADTAISRDLNAYIDFSVLYKYQLNDRLELGTGIKLQHFSNGATRLPNWGLNMAGVHLVISYLPDKTIKQFKKVEKPLIEKRFEYYVMYAGGFRFKQNGKMLDQYYNSTTSIAVSNRLSVKRTLGLGIDVFYNEYFKDDYKNDSAVGLNKLVSQSVFLTSDLIVNKFRMAICLGFYTWRYDDYTLPFYERVALRYYLNQHLFTNVSIKAHAAKAEFIEWGLGVSF